MSEHKNSSSGEGLLDLSVLPKKLYMQLFGNLKNIKINKAALIDLTQSGQADLMLEILKLIYPTGTDPNGNTPMIIDFGSSIGGNTLKFASLKTFVISIEHNLARFKMLEHNVSSYKNVSIFNGNLAKMNPTDKLFSSIKSGAIGFFDPPFGGVKYKYQKSINALYYDDVELCDIIAKFSPLLDTVLIKLPFNYNISNFKRFKELNHKAVKIVILKKFYYIYVLSKYKLDGLPDSYKPPHSPLGYLLNTYFRD